MHHLDGAGIRAIDAQIRARTRRTYALNLWIPLATATIRSYGRAMARRGELLGHTSRSCEYPCRRGPRASGLLRGQIETLLELRPPVFSFVFGVPSAEVLERCRSAGIATLGAATTAAEAKLLADAGVDMIVASGFEAGGHRVSFLQEPEDCLTGTMALIPQVVDAVKVPVIAAGGIADGRGIAAALNWAPAPRRSARRFWPARNRMRRRCIATKLFSAEARRTTLTRAFTGRLARSIHNGFIERCAARRLLAPYPVQAWLTAQFSAAALAADRADLFRCGRGRGRRCSGIGARGIVEVADWRGGCRDGPLRSGTFCEQMRSAGRRGPCSAAMHSTRR